jgi:hypothetical protein
MALLSQAYATKIAQVKDRDRPASSSLLRKRYRKGQVCTEAVDNLLCAVFSTTPSKQAQDNFRCCLSRASH